MKTRSLLYQFGVWFLLFGFLPLVLFGILNLLQFEKKLVSEEINHISLRADSKLLGIKTYLLEREQDAKLLAMEKITETGFSEIPKIYRQFGPGSINYNEAVKPYNERFSAYINSNDLTMFYDLLLITPDGEIIYTYKHESDFATNLVYGPYRNSQLGKIFQESKMSLEFGISEYDMYEPSREPAAFIMTPVIRNGVLLGMLALQLNTARIFHIVTDNNGLGATGETVIAKKIQNGDALIAAPLKNDPDAAFKRTISPEKMPYSLKNALLGQRGNGIVNDYSGTKVVAAWRYLPELQLGMVVKMDASEIFETIYIQRQYFIEILLTFLVMGALLAFYFGRKMVMRIKNIAGVAKEITSGNLDRRVDESGFDEISLLSHSFNEMTNKLQSLYHTLEHRVEQRTVELTDINEHLVNEIREREKIEKNLFENKVLFQTTFDLAEVGIAQMSVDGQWLNVNRKICEILDYSSDELVTLTYHNVTYPEDIDLDKNEIQKIISGNIQHYTIEKRFLRKNQVIIWVSLSIALVCHADGNPDFFITVIEDISERRQKEQALQKFKAIVESTNDAIISLSLNGIIASWNHSAEIIFGYSSEEAIGKPIFIIVPQNRQKEETELLARISHGETISNFETIRCKKDGSIIHISTTISPILGAKKQIIGISKIIHDISSRIQLQEKSQRSQFLLNEAQRLGHLGSWELDLVKNELRWSDEIYRIFEIDPEKFKPSYESFLNVIHPDDRNKVNDAYSQSLENRKPYSIEHRLLFSDGRIKWVREQCTSDFDEEGKPLRSIGAVLDITEQKASEDNLRIASVAFETHEAIVITNIKAEILRVNKAFTTITGFSAESVLGKNPRILSSGRHSKAFYKEMWRQLLTNGSWTGEIWDRKKSGQIYPKWLTITAVKNDLGITTEYVGIFSDITARKQAEDEIRNLAFYDPLTSLPNRRLLLDRFQSSLNTSARTNKYCAVLFMDMDKFKVLNDTLGHYYGDLLLSEVAVRIKSCVRETDTVARLGGDEFVVLIEEIDFDQDKSAQHVASLAEKIRSKLAEPYQLLKHEFRSSPSIGVSLYIGTNETVDDILKHADMAMYHAKDSGRNTVRFFDPQMQKAVESRVAFESDLRLALPENQFMLYYQVQVNNKHKPVGAETLLRWHHPVRGLVSPLEFIPVAEETSLILDIGNWVIEQACRQLSLWSQHKKTKKLSISVNVSAKQFRLENFVETVENLIHQYKINPALLKLELTETLIMIDIVNVVKKMNSLIDLGIKLSMDDFGTGYSSLSYLKQLPINQLKIDQSFVRDIVADVNDAVMVQTIINLAQNFNLEVIAEGVETAEQLAFLKKQGCFAYQGYYFGKPMRIEEFEKLL